MNKSEELQELIKALMENYKRILQQMSGVERIAMVLGEIRSYLTLIAKESENKEFVNTLLSFSIDRAQEAKAWLEQIKSYADEKTVAIDILSQILQNLQIMKKTQIPEIIERIAPSTKDKIENVLELLKKIKN